MINVPFVGIEVGNSVGDILGCAEGVAVGSVDGAREGAVAEWRHRSNSNPSECKQSNIRFSVGSIVGSAVGEMVGCVG